MVVFRSMDLCASQPKSLLNLWLWPDSCRGSTLLVPSVRQPRRELGRELARAWAWASRTSPPAFKREQSGLSGDTAVAFGLTLSGEEGAGGEGGRGRSAAVSWAGRAASSRCSAALRSAAARRCPALLPLRPASPFSACIRVCRAGRAAAPACTIDVGSPRERALVFCC